MRLIEAIVELLPPAFAIGMVVLVIALMPPRRKVSSHEPACPQSGASEDTLRVSRDVREL